MHEEAMLVIGALAYAAGPLFEKYTADLYVHIEIGLQNFEEYQICVVLVGVVGGLYSSLNCTILPYRVEIMTHPLKNLSSSDPYWSIKPYIFSCFGDIALAIVENFENYIHYVMPMMKGAAEFMPKWIVG